MQDDYVEAERRERGFVDRAKRKVSWTKLKWRTSAKGYEFINLDSLNVTVYQRGPGWSFSILDLLDAWEECKPRRW